MFSGIPLSVMGNAGELYVFSFSAYCLIVYRTKIRKRNKKRK